MIGTPGRERGATLGALFDPARNSYAALRLLFAALVVVSHALRVGGFAEPVSEWSGHQENLGGLAVDGFFAVSGFLVLRSWDGDPRVGAFLRRRALRVLPGFWMAVLVVAFAFAPLWAFLQDGFVTRELLSGPAGALAFVRDNLWLNTLQERGIGRLLEGNPVASWADAPFWTLRYEAICYGLVALLGWLGLLRAPRPRALLFAFFGLWLLHALESTRQGLGADAIGAVGDADLLRLGAFFFAGAVCYRFRDDLRVDPRFAAVAAGVLLWTLHRGGFALWAVPLLPLLVHFAACAWKRPLPQLDLSYGIYLYAFPLQQTLALVGFQEHGAAAFTAISLLGSGGIALLSYRLIEAPFLALKRPRAAALPLPAA